MGDFIPFVKPYKSLMIRKKRKALDKHMDNVHMFIKRILDERRKTGSRPEYNDWMGEFMFGNINGSVLTDTEVYAGVMDGFLGGAAQQFTVNWGLYQLSQNPEILDKLYREISEQLGSGDVDASSLHKLKYLNAFVMELYRHQPGGGAIQARMALGKDVLEGFEIPDNTNFVLNVLHVHRDARFWTNPDKFEPERWIRTPYSEIDPYTMNTWGHGGKDCPGKDISIVQMHAYWTEIVKAVKKVEYQGKQNPPQVLMKPLAATEKKMLFKITARSGVNGGEKDEL